MLLHMHSALVFWSPGHEDTCEYAECVCVLPEGREDFRDRLSGIQILLCTLLCESPAQLLALPDLISGCLPGMDFCEN